MEKNGNGNTVLLTVIGVATLLVALVGATFAYFTATVSGNDSQKVSVKAQAPGSLNYTGGDEAITLSNVVPGTKDTQSFDITNGDENNTHQYDLSLVIDSNTFQGTAGQLVFNFSAASTVTDNVPTIVESYDATGKALTGSENRDQDKKVTLVDNATIAPGEKHTYTATLTFADIGENQDVNKTATFSGHFTVENDRTIATAPTTPAE